MPPPQNGPTPALLMQQLRPEEKLVLRIIALLPQPVSLDTLLVATATKAVDLLKILGALADRSLIYKDADLGDGFYTLSDTPDAFSVLKGIPEDSRQEDRRVLIEKLTAALEEGKEKNLTLAHLYSQAGLASQGLAWMMSAAEHLLAEQEKGKAAQYFQIVLDNLEAPASSHDKRQMYMDAVLGAVFAEGHRMPLPAQKSHLAVAWNFARRNKDTERFCPLGLAYGRVSEQIGDYPKAAHVFDEVWQEAERSGDQELLKRTTLMTCDFLFRRGRFSEAIARYEQVVGNLEEFPSDQATLKAYSWLGWCYGITGQTSRGLGLLEAVRKQAEGLDFDEIVLFADMLTVLTLLEARLTGEADELLERILNLPESYAGYFVLMAANLAKAYLLFTRNKLGKSFHFLKEAHKYSAKYGWIHQRGPYALETLEGLEKAGFVHPQMTLDSELERMKRWPDIFMRGAAYGMQARRFLEGHQQPREALLSINKAIALLNEAGAKLELARAQIVKARILIHLNRTSKAGTLLQESWEAMSSINVDMFPSDLKPLLKEVDTKELVINTFVEVSKVLGTVRHRESLLKRIINLTMTLTTAQGGAVFLRGDTGELELAASRNLSNDMVESKGFRPHMALIEQAAEAQKEIFREPSEGNGRPGSPSKSEKGWVLCIPIILGDNLLGVLYHNGRLRPKEPLEGDLNFLSAIGNQVAVALDNLQAYENIATLKDRLQEEALYYRSKPTTSPLLANIVGESNAMLRVQKDMEKVAATDSTVLITGETGVGKELVARGIHTLSDRSDGPFIAANLASYSEGVVSSELFGHEKGAFTGAVYAHTGLFELAHGGTLFLDDIQYLPLEIQVKLLRVLQEKEFTRVGGSKAIKADFRLVAATNVPLLDLTAKGDFRSDLYYRLNVFPIRIPPLRERVDDIPILAARFMDTYVRKFGKNVRSISKNNLNRLCSYDWPGNIRELKHVIERGVVISDGETLIIPEISPGHKQNGNLQGFNSLEEVQRSFLKDVLKECSWKVSGPGGVAELLNMKPSTLYSKLKRLGISLKQPDADLAPDSPGKRPG